MRRILTFTILFLFIINIATPSFAEILQQNAKIIGVSGKVEFLRDGQTNWQEAKVGIILNVNDTIKTAKSSTAQLQLIEKGDKVIVDEETSVKIIKLEKDTITNDNQTLLDVAVGSVLLSADKLKSKQSKFEVDTPNVIVGVRGTRFEVKVAK